MKNFQKNKSCIGCIALHGMAYYIFLKSLRSLEEFRKNPHVKIPTKSSSTIFQSLAIIKNQILFRKESFLHFRPNRPSGQPAHPASPPSQPHRFAKSRLFFEFAQPGDDAFSLCHRQAGPTHQLHLPPSAGRSRPRRRLTSPLSAIPHHPASTSRCRIKELTPPPGFPRVNPPP
jgi:hypothetical protein